MANKTSFKKGIIPWNKGKKMPEEFGLKISNNNERSKNISRSLTGKKLTDATRLKMSLAKKGKPILHFIKNWDTIKAKISQTQKGKPRPHQQGSNHGGWQGGITPINFKIRNSLEYKQWRESVFQRDNWTCQICAKKGMIIHAHHIIPFSMYPEGRFSIDNGITLCKKCHKIADKKNLITFRLIQGVENGLY